MGLSTILITTLLTTSPDLCADVYVDDSGQPYTDALGQTWSRFCAPKGTSAPILDHDVCCVINGDSAQCAIPNNEGRCSTGSKMYCKYGEVRSSGVAVCYQSLPSACDLGFCESALPLDAGPLEDDLCCWGDGTCTEIETIEHVQACNAGGGYLGYCKNGAQNTDGTVDCFE